MTVVPYLDDLYNPMESDDDERSFEDRSFEDRSLGDDGGIIEDQIVEQQQQQSQGNCLIRIEISGYAALPDNQFSRQCHC